MTSGVNLEVTIVLLVKNHVGLTPHMTPKPQNSHMTLGDLFKVTKIMVGQFGPCRSGSVVRMSKIVLGAFLWPFVKLAHWAGLTSHEFAHVWVFFGVFRGSGIIRGFKGLWEGLKKSLKKYQNTAICYLLIGHSINWD